MSSPSPTAWPRQPSSTSTASRSLERRSAFPTDIQTAAEHYFRQAKNEESERQAKAIRQRAEVRAGELLKVRPMAKAPPGPGRGNKTPSAAVSPFPDEDRPKTLLELGISYEQSSKWQKLSEVPKDKLELAIANGMATTTIINKYGVKKPGATERVSN